MKKVTGKLWVYGITFLLRAFIFDLALGFTIAALVMVKDGLTLWAIISIAFAGTWVFLWALAHFTWMKLSHGERALYFGLRRYGVNVVKVYEDEVNRRTGQRDTLEILRDTDASLEIQMIINGTFWLINIMIGIKWIYHAVKFSKNEETLTIEVVKEEK